jgi:hypothetical protein
MDAHRDYSLLALWHISQFCVFENMKGQALLKPNPSINLQILITEFNLRTPTRSLACLFVVN